MCVRQTDERTCHRIYCTLPKNLVVKWVNLLYVLFCGWKFSHPFSRNFTLKWLKIQNWLVAVNATEYVKSYRHSYEQNAHIFTYSFNDANPKSFHCKRFEPVKMLQIEFDTMDFTHFYDLHRWNFLSSVLKKGWCHFRTMLDMQLHSYSNHAHVYGYNSDNCSSRDCVSHCVQMCLLYFFYLFRFLLFLCFFFFVALVANKGV